MTGVWKHGIKEGDYRVRKVKDSRHNIDEGDLDAEASTVGKKSEHHSSTYYDSRIGE